MTINFQSARFLTSASTYAQCPPDTGAEVAFCGRSNAGKSSAINALTRQKSLARASKTPGRTRLLNFFALDGQEPSALAQLEGRKPSALAQPEGKQPSMPTQGNQQLRLVDLPGYGYAKAPKSMQELWQAQIDLYLCQRQSLRGMALLMDSRHPPKPFDLMTIAWAEERQLPLHLLLTKVDKLSKGAGLRALAAVKPELGETASAQLFSSTTGLGLEELAARLTELLTGS